MILLLGATTYIGRAFTRLLRGRKHCFIPLSRQVLDYSRFELLFDYVRQIKPDLVINAEELTERADLDDSPGHRAAMFETNAILPQTVARVCAMTHTVLGHISSGSIYSGVKLADDGLPGEAEGRSRPQTGTFLVLYPQAISGFTETDTPNASFENPACSFYSGTKALAEEALRDSRGYIWRFLLPFNERDGPENFLSQLGDGFKFQDCMNSLSHVEDCAGACLDLWERRAPFGIYNVVNPGPVRTFELRLLLQRSVKSGNEAQVSLYNGGLGTCPEKNVPPGCILDSSKLARAGVKLREARRAVEESLRNWAPEISPTASSLRA